MPWTHGLINTPMYTVWCSMKERCYNKHDKSYKNYGARGITVCDDWLHSYPTFYEWAIKSGYEKGLSIERIDNDKGYSPDNCKWADKTEQSRNRRNVIQVTYKGETKCLAEWARELGISRGTIKSRIDVGMSIEEAFTKKDWRVNNGGRKKKTH